MASESGQWESRVDAMLLTGNMQHFGKYQVAEKIGEGGFGVIYKGFDPGIQRTVAIKTCTSEDQDIRERFVREARIAGNLHHRNITIVYDFGTEGGVPYLVQEYLTGEDLDHKIKRGDDIPFGTKILYLIQVARGLEYAHRQGVIHRDVKPGNIRVLDDGTVRIMDFGIAKLLSSAQTLTTTGETIGTAAYLSPEQIRGESIDHRADIFAFGTLAYELLSGQRAFQGDNPSTVLYRVLTAEPPPMEQVAPTCPDECTRIISRCMRKKREDRYPECGELLAELSQLIEMPDDDSKGHLIAPPLVDLAPASGELPLPQLDGETRLLRDTVGELELRGRDLDAGARPRRAPDHPAEPSDRSSTVGVLLLILVAAALATGGWWYLEGYRAQPEAPIPASGVTQAPLQNASSEAESAPVSPPPVQPTAAETRGAGSATPSEPLSTPGEIAGASEPPVKSADSTDSATTPPPDPVPRQPPEVTTPAPRAETPPVTRDSRPARATPALLTIKQMPQTPRAWVLANGKPLGQTPLRDTELPPGQYDLTLSEKPERQGRSIGGVVELRSGQVTIVTFDLDSSAGLQTVYRPIPSQ